MLSAFSSNPIANIIVKISCWIIQKNLQQQKKKNNSVDFLGSEDASKLWEKIKHNVEVTYQLVKPR